MAKVIETILMPREPNWTTRKVIWNYMCEGEAVVELSRGGACHGGSDEVESADELYAGLVNAVGLTPSTTITAVGFNAALLRACDCLSKHGDAFADLGALTILQDYLNQNAEEPTNDRT